MEGFSKYGSVENLYRSNEVLEHTVVVTEKLHGTNVRFMWDDTNGGLILGSRNNIIYKDGVRTDGDGYNFAGFMVDSAPVKELAHRPYYYRYVFYGEFHGSSIQKGVKYADEKDLRVFDIRDPDDNFVDWELVAQICDHLGFKTVPVLLEGRVTLDDLNEIMNKNSKTAEENGIEAENNIAEGVVIKPLKMRKDHRDNWIRAKFKSEKWAENAKAPKVRKPDPELAALQPAAREFAEAVVTEGRVATIVDHITRDGDTELNVRRTGEFLRAFINDVKDEHAEVYALLDKKQQNQYNKVVNGQAQLLWQEYLVRQ